MKKRKKKKGNEDERFLDLKTNLCLSTEVTKKQMQLLIFIWKRIKERDIVSDNNGRTPTKLT